MMARIFLKLPGGDQVELVCQDQDQVVRVATQLRHLYLLNRGTVAEIRGIVEFGISAYDHLDKLSAAATLFEDTYPLRHLAAILLDVGALSICFEDC